jgi:hypothetical protein
MSGQEDGSLSSLDRTLLAMSFYRIIHGASGESWRFKEKKEIL